MKKILNLLLIISLLHISVIAKIIEKIEVKENIYSLFNSNAAIVVITDADLERLKISDLSSLFKILPGVNVMRRGPSDTSFDISMSGGNFEQTVVLLEGIPVNNPQTGHFNTDIPIGIGDIERIVITKGVSNNSSSLGLSGTINIILKKQSKLRFSITGGDKNLFSLNVSNGIKAGKFNIGLSGAKRNSTGYYKGNEFNTLNFLSYIKFKEEKFSADFKFGKVKKNLGANNFYADYPSIESIDSWFANLSVKESFGNSEILFSYMKNVHDDSFILDRYNRSLYSNKSITGKDFLRFYALTRRNEISFSGGFDVVFEDMKSSMMGVVKRKRGGIFIDISKERSTWSYDAEFRMELILNSMPVFTYNFNFFKKIRENFSLKISSGRKIRLPSFTELYYNSPANIGNRDLKREVSFNNQILFSFYRTRSVLTLSLYLKNQNNIIDWTKSPQDKVWSASNISEKDIFGFEISGNLNFVRGGISSSVEKIFSLNNNHGFESKYGLRFPDLLLKIRGFYKITNGIDFSSVYIYKRIFKTTQKGNFLDISLSVSIGKYEMTLHADNLFNTIIEEIPGIKVPGRWIYISFSLKNS